MDALQLLQLRVAECLLLAVFELRLLAVVRPLVHVDFVGVVRLVCEAAVHLFNVVVAVADQDLSVGVEEFVVVVVGDLAAVDDLPDHVLERLVVDFVAGQNVLFGLDQCHVEVSRVELLRHAESDRSEFTALDYAAVQLAKHLDHATEVLGFLSVEDLFEAVLVDHGGVDAVETVLHALGRFVGDLDAHLQHAERVLVGGVAGEEQAEVFVDHLG